MKFKTDLITASRVYRLLKKYGVKDIPKDSFGGILSSIHLSNLDTELPGKIVELLEIDEPKVDDIIIMSEYLGLLAEMTQEYEDEINNRKQFVIDKNIWTQDEPEKSDELYDSDHYLHVFMVLSENNINPCILSIYEAFILYEDIITNKLKESCGNMLAMLDTEKYQAFIDQMKNLMKYGNFSAFVLDIYNEIEKKYEQQTKDKSRKQ